jgi:hypothetical protein
MQKKLMPRGCGFPYVFTIYTMSRLMPQGRTGSPLNELPANRRYGESCHTVPEL